MGVSGRHRGLAPLVEVQGVNSLSYLLLLRMMLKHLVLVVEHDHCGVGRICDVEVELVFEPLMFSYVAPNFVL